MNSIKVLVIILVFRDSHSVLWELPSGIKKTSLVKTESNLSFSSDINDLMKKLNSNVNVKSILNSLNVIVSDDGLLDLKSLFPNLVVGDHVVNLTDILSSLDVKVSDGVLDLKSLLHKLTNDKEWRSVNKSEDQNLDFVGLGQKYNLIVEEHTVTTEDGYILTVFHIPGNGSSVLCSHGLLDTSDTFIIRGKISLGYILAQNGFDVWALNYRGNRYSRSHQTLDPDTDKVYWDFSLHEKGYYDLSAVIDFILEKTGQDQLSVIGHSEGTATVFVLTSTQPEYNKKIKLFIAMSPVCYLSDSGIAIKAGIRLWPILDKLLRATGIQELLGYNSLIRKLVQRICLQGTVGYDLCYTVALGTVVGYSPENVEKDFWYTVMGHYPAGASRKEVDHYVQIGKSNIFGQYDYGSENIKVYGSKTAPSYNLNNVTCKVSLFVSKNDKIFGQKAGKRLQSELSNVVDYYLVEYEWFNHVDFVLGKNAHVYVYSHLIELLNSYT